MRRPTRANPFPPSWLLQRRSRPANALPPFPQLPRQAPPVVLQRPGLGRGVQCAGDQPVSHASPRRGQEQPVVVLEHRTRAPGQHVHRVQLHARQRPVALAQAGPGERGPDHHPMVRTCPHAHAHTRVLPHGCAHMRAYTPPVRRPTPLRPRRIIFGGHRPMYISSTYNASKPSSDQVRCCRCSHRMPGRARPCCLVLRSTARLLCHRPTRTRPHLLTLSPLPFLTPPVGCNPAARACGAVAVGERRTACPVGPQPRVPAVLCGAGQRVRHALEARRGRGAHIHGPGGHCATRCRHRWRQPEL